MGESHRRDATVLLAILHGQKGLPRASTCNVGIEYRRGPIDQVVQGRSSGRRGTLLYDRPSAERVKIAPIEIGRVTLHQERGMAPRERIIVVYIHKNMVVAYYDIF